MNRINHEYLLNKSSPLFCNCYNQVLSTDRYFMNAEDSRRKDKFYLSIILTYKDHVKSTFAYLREF